MTISAIELTCIECGERFEVDRGPGRYPSKCPDCGPPVPLTANERRQQRMQEEQARRRIERELQPLLANPNAMMHVDALISAAHRAAELPSAERGDLKRAVVRLAHARGVAETRDRAIDVAATAIAWATSIPPAHRDNDPVTA